jgi:hypothetical protein
MFVEAIRKLTEAMKKRKQMGINDKHNSTKSKQAKKPLQGEVN